MEHQKTPLVKKLAEVEVEMEEEVEGKKEEGVGVAEEKVEGKVEMGQELQRQRKMEGEGEELACAEFQEAEGVECDTEFALENEVGVVAEGKFLEGEALVEKQGEKDKRHLAESREGAPGNSLELEEVGGDKAEMYGADRRGLVADIVVEAVRQEELVGKEVEVAGWVETAGMEEV